MPLLTTTSAHAGGECSLSAASAKRHTPGLPPRPALPRCREEEEKANAVEKRGHMGDFYRNLLRSNVAFGGKPAEAKPAARQAAEQAQQPAGEGDRGRAADESVGEEAEEPQWLPRSPARGREDMAGTQQPAEAAAPSEAAQQQQGQAAEQTQVEDALQAAGAQAPGRGSDGGNSEAATGAAASPAELAARAGQRRNQEDAVAAARERYLARKRQKTGIQG